MQYRREDFNCRFGQPHDIRIVHENPHRKIEACNICRKRFRWNKGYKGRTDNVKYLKAHARNFAQPGGATARLYRKIYQPETCIITV